MTRWAHEPPAGTGWPWRPVVLLVVIACLCAYCTGCSTRENARAVVQADQAVDGAGRVLTAQEVHDALAQLPPEVRESVEGAFRQALDLLASARTSLAPVVAILAPSGPPDVPTTVRQAVEEPRAFVAAAAKQAGRAEAEAAASQTAHAYGAWLAGWATGGDGSFGAGDALALGVQGVLAALGLGGAGTAVVQVLRTIPRLRRAVAEREAAVKAAAAYADDLERAETDEDVEQVKNRHAARQAEIGVRPLIQRLRGKAA